MTRFSIGWLTRARTPAATAEHVSGHVDSVERGVVRGWAARRSRPHERVAVKVVVDGRVVARDVAGLFRDDLDAAGWGDGRHGFEIRLPSEFVDGDLHRLEVLEEENSASLISHTSVYRLAAHPTGGPTCADLLFDSTFYQLQSGVRQRGLDHYKRVGWRAGHDPHPLFSTAYYLSLWPEAARTDPLTHFEAVGQHGASSTHPLLDADLFRDHPLPNGSARHPVLRYLLLNHSDRPSISRYFSDAHYRTQVDLRGTEFSPLIHYLSYGVREGRSPASGFDPRLFRKLAGLDGSVEPFTWFVRSLSRPTPPLPADSDDPPVVSVIVLNHNKALLTLQCLFHLRRHSDPRRTEIIVVDNGSANDDFDLLCRHAGEATIIRIECNRGYGEGCNIGSEHARGEFLLFLNNDAFLAPGALDALMGPLRHDASIGATGPRLLFANGTLQEAGALISVCGTAVQRGRGLDPAQPALNREEAVDYCSGAALLVRTASFRRVLGFDPCWDPAYYEDADLCLKLRVAGERTVYVPAATVFHLEHATAADRSLDLQLDDIIRTNRLKFVGRWSEHLSGRALFPADHFEPPPPRPGPRGERPRLGLFTPYPLMPGGGERYLLTMAEALSDDYRTTLQTPARYSGLRLASIGRELGLDLGDADLEVHSDAILHAPFDLFVCMGNHLFPSVPAYGRLALYHCQFPFPMAPDQTFALRRNLATYAGILVNSAFTADNLARQAEVARVRLPPVFVLPPPVPQIGSGSGPRDGPRRIVSVGRFAPGGHCKRQDVMLEEFRHLLARTSEEVELHLAGTLGSQAADRAYLHELVDAARDMPVRFHVDPTARQIVDLYRSASLYWHLTGAGEDAALRPERFEHFGIAIVEAMSAGLVPLAIRGGGPLEIITEGRDGFFVDRAADLPSKTAALLQRPDLLAEVGERAALRARDFSPASFNARLRRVIEQVGSGRNSSVSRPVQPMSGAS